MNTRPDGFKQVVDGVGFSMRSRVPFLFKCCDCGLTHRVALVAGDKGWIGIAMERVRQEKRT